MEALNLLLIVALTIAASGWYRESWYWSFLAFVVLSAVFSLSRLRLIFGVDLGGAVLMPHAILAVLAMAALLVRGAFRRTNFTTPRTLQNSALRPSHETVSSRIPRSYLAMIASVLLAATFALMIHPYSRADWALFGLLTFLLPALFFFAASQLTHHEKMSLLNLTATAVALSIITGLPVYFATDRVVALLPGIAINGSRILTTLGNSITQGSICLLVMPWLLTAFAEKRTIWHIMLFFLAGIGIILSGSRLLLPIFGLFVGVQLLWGAVSAQKRALLTATGLAVSAVSFVFLTRLIPTFTEPLMRIVMPGEEALESTLRRELTLRTGLRLILEQPVFGYGPSQVYDWSRWSRGSSTVEHFIVLRQGVTLTEPHNLIVMIAVEYGVPTLVAFLGVMLSLLWRLRESRRGASSRLERAALIGVVLFVLQTAGSSDVAIFPHIGTLFWIWCGCCTDSGSDACSAIPENRPQPLRVPVGSKWSLRTK